MSKKTKNKSINPQHVAIICDGNRRWAREKGLPVFMGHDRAVKKTIDDLVDAALKLKIPYITFWVFSTENWNRAKDEVDWLMNLFRHLFDKKLKELAKKDVKIKMIGNRDGLAEDIQAKIIEGEKETENNNSITVTFAMNYGGHDELVRAFGEIASEVESGKLKAKDVSEELIESYLDTFGDPDPDMIIRTSGELRLSGFMSWQSEYAEYFFPSYSFPDFTGERLIELVEEFKHRQRRFGGS